MKRVLNSKCTRVRGLWPVHSSAHAGLRSLHTARSQLSHTWQSFVTSLHNSCRAWRPLCVMARALSQRCINRRPATKQMLFVSINIPSRIFHCLHSVCMSLSGITLTDAAIFCHLTSVSLCSALGRLRSVGTFDHSLGLVSSLSR